ncbi:MAG: NAD-dependent epimerase/dehydratase family protein [Coriobacteriia bacterium]|nr:NAD-dependent epimerase/dehydratase family protein [Coriobacteriia bacterium]
MSDLSYGGAASVREDCRAALATYARQLRPLAGERVLVTGGTGFMGAWLAWMISVLNDDYDFGIDLMLLSPHAREFKTRIPELAGRADITFIERDVCDITALPADVHYVIHAAGNPDSRVHASDPLRTMSVIADGTRALLDAVIEQSNVKSVLMVSSGLVYGGQPLEVAAVSESYRGGPECNTIASVYAESKRFAETASAAYCSQYKLPIVTARPFAFIGPYQLLDKPWAVNNFIRDAIHGGPIRILGNSETVRSYMYPSDMAVWLLAILVNGVPGTAYNVGSPNGVTLGRLADTIAARFSSPPEVVFRAVGDQRPSRFVPDISRAKDLGLELTVGLEDALARSIAWHSARARA